MSYKVGESPYAILGQTETSQTSNPGTPKKRGDLIDIYKNISGIYQVKNPKFTMATYSQAGVTATESS